MPISRSMRAATERGGTAPPARARCDPSVVAALSTALVMMASPHASASSPPREIVRMVGDVRVRVILTEAVFGRLYLENRLVRERPDMCSICERMAVTSDSLIWIPVGIKWKKEESLVIDPVIDLVADGHTYRSCESWVGRPTRGGLVTIRTPARIPPGWECDPEFKDWTGVSVYVAFPRETRRDAASWPVALHLEDVVDARVQLR